MYFPQRFLCSTVCSVRWVLMFSLPYLSWKSDMLVVTILLLLAAVVLECAPYNVLLLCQRTTSPTDCLVSDGFLRSQFIALQAFAAETNSTAAWAVVSYAAEDSNIRDLSNYVRQYNANHVVFTPQAQPLLEAVGSLFPHLNFTIVDTTNVALAPHMRNRTEAVSFREDQAGYLAGVLAGAQSQTGRVAGIFGPRYVALKNFGNGFRQGVLRSCPGCRVGISYLGSFRRTFDSTAISLWHVNQTADVVFGAAGIAGTAAIQTVANRSKWVIGVDTDEYLTTFGNGTEPNAEFILASAVKRVDVGVVASVRNAYLGRPIVGDRVGSIANGVVQLTECHESCRFIEQRTLSLVSTFTEQLREGVLETGVDPLTGDVLYDRTDPAAAVSLATPHPYTLGGRYNTSFTTIPVSTGEMVLLLSGGAWDPVVWFDASAAAFSHEPLQTSIKPRAAIDFAACSVELPSGAQIAVVIGGKLPNGTHASMSLYTFDFGDCPSLNRCQYWPRWEIVSVAAPTPLPSRRHGHVVVADQTRIHLLGGIDAQGEYLLDHWSLDLNVSFPTTRASSWRMLPSLPSRRAFHAAAIWWCKPGYRGHVNSSAIILVAGGGSSSVDLAPRRIEMFSTALLMWLSAENLQTDESIGRRACLLLPNEVSERLLIMQGGRSQTSSPSALLSYSPSRNVVDTIGLQLPTSSPAREGYCATYRNPSPPVSGATNARSSQARPHHFYYLPIGSDSTVDLIDIRRPAVACNAQSQFIVSPNLTTCIFCEDGVDDGACVDCGANGCGGPPSVTLVVFFVLIAVVFVLGIVIGLTLRLFGSKDGSSVSSAPRKMPCALAIVLVPSTTQRWRSVPHEMGQAMKQYQEILRKTILRHQCYHVRAIGDAHFIAAEDGDQMIRMVLDIFREMKNASWPNRRSVLTPGCALHFGSPSVVPSDTGGVDYIGSEIDALTKLATKARSGEIIATMSLIRNATLDDFVEFATGDPREFFDESENTVHRYYSYQIYPEGSIASGGSQGSSINFGGDADASGIASTSVVTGVRVDVALPVLLQGANRVPLYLADNHPLVVDDSFMTMMECHAALELIGETLAALIAPLSEKEKRTVLGHILKWNLPRTRVSGRRTPSTSPLPQGAVGRSEFVTVGTESKGPLTNPDGEKRTEDIIAEVAVEALKRVDVVELKMIAKQSVRDQRLNSSSVATTE